jgi:hypothetical protein
MTEAAHQLDREQFRIRVDDSDGKSYLLGLNESSFFLELAEKLPLIAEAHVDEIINDSSIARVVLTLAWHFLTKNLHREFAKCLVNDSPEIDEAIIREEIVQEIRAILKLFSEYPKINRERLEIIPGEKIGRLLAREPLFFLGFFFIYPRAGDPI